MPSPASSPPTTRSGSPRSAVPRWPRPARSSPPACPRCWAATRPRCWPALEALDLIPANRNAAGQIVAAGTIAALEKLAEDPRQRPGCVRWPPRVRSTPATWPRRWTGTRPPRRGRHGPSHHHAAVQLRRPGGHLRPRRDDQARRAVDPSGASGTCAPRPCVSSTPRRSSSSRPRAPLTGIAKRELRASRRTPSRHLQTWTDWPISISRPRSRTTT